jgi:hypothetical protein
MQRPNHDKRTDLYEKTRNSRESAFRAWSEHTAISHEGNGRTCPTCHYLSRELERTDQEFRAQSEK